MPVFRIILLSLVILLSSCAKNPVTGKSEWHLVSSQKEIQMGEQNYRYGQQMGQGVYHQDPALTAYVQSVGKKLAQVSDRPHLPFEFVILNDSVPNAWAMPGGKLAINRGLLVELKNEAELAAVLGHEITHATARHSAKAIERQLLLSGALMATNIALTANQHGENALRNDAIMATAALAGQLVNTKYGRHAELEADAYGMEYMVKAGYDPMAAVTLQETFVRLSKNKSSNWLKGLFASHPPSAARVKANLQRTHKFPIGLTVNEETFQKKIAKLKKQQAAYELYDKGREALQKKRYLETEIFAEQAIDKLPTEALFYGLKGDLTFALKRYDEALECYNQAIALDDQYYYYFQQRGLLLKKMGRSAQAKQDLKRSQEKLPKQGIQQALQGLA